MCTDTVSHKAKRQRLCTAFASSISTRAQSSAHFSALPDELWSRVMIRSESVADILALSSTCQAMRTDVFGEDRLQFVMTQRAQRLCQRPVRLVSGPSRVVCFFEFAWRGVVLKAMRKQSDADDPKSLHESVALRRQKHTPVLVVGRQAEGNIKNTSVSRFHMIVSLPTAEEVLRGTVVHVEVIGLNGISIRTSNAMSPSFMSLGMRASLSFGAELELSPESGIRYQVQPFWC